MVSQSHRSLQFCIIKVIDYLEWYNYKYISLFALMLSFPLATINYFPTCYIWLYQYVFKLNLSMLSLYCHEFIIFNIFHWPAQHIAITVKSKFKNYLYPSNSNWQIGSIIVTYLLFFRIITLSLECRIRNYIICFPYKDLFYLYQQFLHIIFIFIYKLWDM